MIANLIIPACFYVFSSIILGAGFGVVKSKNPVHSVLFLLLAFLGSAGLFILLGAELLAMILIIVYGGAVAVLFLFVVMMLNCETPMLNTHRFPLHHLKSWLVLFIGIIGAGELLWVAMNFRISPMAFHLLAAPGKLYGGKTNAHALGSILYTDYLYLFQIAGLVLLVAMIGAIILTHRVRDRALKQKIQDQINRSKKDTLELKRMPIGKGIKL